jgi:adenosylmethionine-8-amino-7-oxononanoate aminotransferase
MILIFDDILYNELISGVRELIYRLAVVSWTEPTISLSLHILRAIEHWGELQRCFFRTSGQLAVSLKKKISTIER